MKSEEIIQNMTLAEKVSLLSGADLWHTKSIARLGVPSLKMTDGPYGARGAAGKSGPSSACFPVGVAMAATWDPGLVQQLGAALGEETKDKGAQVLLGPTVNIPRTPLAGRNFECFSEDPFLTSRLAVAYIRGVQNQGIGACIKHFVCNDAEHERFSMSSELPERALHEIYLAPFRAAIQEANPWAVMAAYNRLNGVSCSENQLLLKKILKDGWGFDGLIVSDWMGTYSKAAVKAGLDLEMPGPGRWMGENVEQMVETGELSINELDDKVMRLLRMVEKAGLLDMPASTIEISNDRPVHRHLIRMAGSQAMVLLKNERNILPLALPELRSIAVIGELASRPAILGGGSSEVNPHYAVSLMDAIREEADVRLQLDYSDGYSISRQLPLMDFSWLQNSENETKGMLVEFYKDPDFSREPAGRWFTERPEITFADEILAGVDPNRFSAKISGVFTAPASGIYDFELDSNLDCRLWLNDQLLLSKNGKQVPGQGLREGKALKSTYQLEAGRVYQLQIEADWEGELPWRELAIRCAPASPDGTLQQAVELARKAEVVILVAGLTKEWESEGFDRKDMRLPGRQDELIQQVTAVNPNTIVILNSGSPLEMPWLDGAAAVLQAWYLGQESGHAIADVLFGRQSPGGKLPVTFPQQLRDNPTYLHYPGENGKHIYSEGIFVGYRYYQRKGIRPLFPFGYGLSYTSFTYKDFALSSQRLNPGESLKARVMVENVGHREGSEVVQWYLHQKHPILVRPERWLVGFLKVDLQPGELRPVEFELETELLAYYDDLGESWEVQPGGYTLMVGSSCEDIHFQGDFEMMAGEVLEDHSRIELSIDSTLGDLLADADAREVLRKHVGPLIDHPQIEMALGMTLYQIAGFVPELLTKELLSAIAADLSEP